MAIVFAKPNITKKVLVCFADLFKKVQITSKNGEKYIIPIKIGTKEKLYSMSQVLDEDRNKFRYSLPLMGFALNSLSFDANRALNQANTLSSTSKTEQLRQPVPYNFSIELYVLANRASELFEILEIILPMYQQARYFPMIEYKFLDGSEIKRDLPIILDSNSFEIKGDVGAEEEQVFSTNLSFTIQGYLHNSYLKVDSSLISHWQQGGDKVGDGFVIDGNGGLGPIQNIDIAYEEYIENQFSRLMGTVSIQGQSGGDAVTSTSGDL